ncbi:MAG: hypothetical protein SGI84_10075 [Gemmatimonadota bacterium]|nr:hypothetical protein [Gemmatimonadota bacterium]
MRPPVIAGLVLIVAAAFVLIRGGSFTSRDEVLSVGDLKVTATERQTIPTWVAGLGLVAGIALVATNLKQKS